MAEVGAPAEAATVKPAARLGERLRKWTYETFTVPGRTEAYERKYTRMYQKVKDKLSPEDQARAEKLIRHQAEQAAKKSIIRDVVVTTLGTVGVVVGIWKRREIGGFIGRHTPERAKDAASKLAEKARKFGETMHGWTPVQKIEGWIQGIVSRFRRTPTAPAA